MGYFSISYAGDLTQTQSAAFGALYSGHPTAAQGSATWRGTMHGETRKAAIGLGGESRLTYDFDGNTVDLAVSIMPILDDANYTGPPSIRWPSIQANADGSFYIPGYGNDKANTGLHPTLGYVDGDFYGPNAEEFAGVFERQFGNDGDSVVGAFGGVRLRE